METSVPICSVTHQSDCSSPVFSIFITRYLDWANFSTSNNEMAVDLYFTLTQVWVGLWIAAEVGPTHPAQPGRPSCHQLQTTSERWTGASSGKSPQFLVPKLSTTNWNCNTNQDCQSPTPGSGSNCTSSLTSLDLTTCVCTAQSQQLLESSRAWI